MSVSSMRSRLDSCAEATLYWRFQMDQLTPTPNEGMGAETRLSSTPDVESINIRPEVSVLGVFRHLNYRPWFAAAEFVDNAIQSFQDHQHELARVAGHTGKLLVKVKIDTSDEGFIQVSDNAAGIYRDEWARAFRPAEPPPDTSGLAEFGDGHEDGCRLVWA